MGKVKFEEVLTICKKNHLDIDISEVFSITEKKVSPVVSLLLKEMSVSEATQYLYEQMYEYERWSLIPKKLDLGNEYFIGFCRGLLSQKNIDLSSEYSRGFLDGQSFLRKYRKEVEPE